VQRLLPAMALPALVAVLAAGCGGTSANPGVANLGTVTTTTTSSSGNGASSDTSKESVGRAFSACMRSHGVPNFPDPSSSGGIQINGSIDPNSPQFQAAQRVCQKLLPAGGAPSPAQQAKMQAQLLKFSACMRSHGEPNFPDPQFPSGGGARLSITRGSGIDPQSPQFQQAQNFCRQYLPGGGKGITKQAPGPAQSSGSASGGSVRGGP
jgi:hypothetical protein